jgi:hypothetical protein
VEEHRLWLIFGCVARSTHTLTSHISRLLQRHDPGNAGLTYLEADETRLRVTAEARVSTSRVSADGAHKIVNAVVRLGVVALSIGFTVSVDDIADLLRVATCDGCNAAH